MTAHLDRARYASIDLFEGPAICFAQTVQTGKRGRPRVEIEPSLLSTALGLRPKTQIAETAKCCARTVRRRQLDYGINVPGPSPPVHNGGVPQVAVISDEELDQYLVIIMQDFPSFGRRLATACLKANGVSSCSPVFIKVMLSSWTIIVKVQLILNICIYRIHKHY